MKPDKLQLRNKFQDIQFALAVRPSVEASMVLVGARDRPGAVGHLVGWACVDQFVGHQTPVYHSGVESLSIRLQRLRAVMTCDSAAWHFVACVVRIAEHTLV